MDIDEVNNRQAEKENQVGEGQTNKGDNFPNTFKNQSDKSK